MADVEPFRAIRYDGEIAGDLASVVSPPYDVISPKLLRELRSKSPYNAVRLELPEGDGDIRYKNAADFYSRWIADGVLKRDPEPSIYPYYQNFEFEGNRYTRKGFIANVKVEDFDRKIILPHEQTFSRHKEDRLKLTLACDSNMSQVFCVYPDPEGAVEKIIDENLGEPLAEVAPDGGITNSLWKISNPERILEVKNLLKDGVFLIADGHHRYETSINFRNLKRKETGKNTGAMPWDYVTMYLTRGEGEGLIINPTHRMAENTEDGLIRRLRENFRLERISPEDSLELGSDQISVVTKDPAATFRLTPKKRREKKHENLAVIILHDLVFGDILNEEKAGVSYSKFPEEVFENVHRGPLEVGFLLPKLKSDDIFEVVLNGNKMPHKTTYFYPKILSGLVFGPLW